MRLLHLSTLLFTASITLACGGDGASTATSTSGAGSSSSATTSADSSSSATTGAGGASTSTSTSTGTGGAGGAPVDKSADCASTFGSALTNAFGRIDGTVLAVVKPINTQCAMPNSDHLVLQVAMAGAAYRMVVNLESSSGDPKVRFQSLPHALPPPAWSEGWHTGLKLDYVLDLGVHTDKGFTPYPLAELADVVTDAITVGQKVSVYATSSGGASAHLVHRNVGGKDGAIVIDPDGSPKLLLFHFANQSF